MGTIASVTANVLVAHRSVPANTLKDLVEYVKKNPGKLSYASFGNGTTAHFAGEMFKKQAGLFIVHIPYAGAPPAQLALLSGQVDFNFDNLAAAATNIRSGKLKALAVTSSRRSGAMPDVPTVAEAGARLGLTAFDVGTWFGLFGPARLPADVTARLNKAFTDALAAPELRARMASLMAEPSPSTPDQFGAMVKAELAKYQAVVKASGAKID